MHRSIIVILSFLSSAAFASAASTESVAVPRLVVPVSSHDFGHATVGDRLANTFVLRNDGTATLEIRDAQSDCACVTTSYDKTIAAGAAGELRVVFDTTEMIGALSQKVTLSTNDPAIPSITFTIAARVPPILNLFPGYVRYIYVQKEIPGRVAQTVWASDGKDFDILAVKSPYPFLTTSFREATPEERRPAGKGKQWRVETVLSPDAPVGAIGDWVEITTNHPKHKTTRFEVSGFVRPVIAVTPASAEFGVLKSDHPKLGSFRVQVFSTDEVNVTSVDTDVKGLTLALEALQPGRNYSIHVSLAAPARKGDFQGTMRIHTASAKAPMLEVPISGRIE